MSQKDLLELGLSQFIQIQKVKEIYQKNQEATFNGPR